MQTTVPTLPDNTTGWRKTITALTDAKGGAAVEGVWLEPGDDVELPAGTLILAVDKVTTGWDYGYRTGERYAIQDATVTVHITHEDGLAEVWRRHYKNAKSAFGATTMKKLAALLAQHPAPAGTVTVVTEARRPNRKTATCRWCHTQLSAGRGHLVGHGDDLTAECWQACPVHSTTVGVCELCGVTIAPSTPAGVMVIREGAGRRSLRHLPEVNCVEHTPESAEQYRERLAAIYQAEAVERAERAEKARQAEERKAKRAAAKRAAAEAAEKAEAERVAALTETGRTTANLNDKGLGGSLRAALDEITVRLSDGTTTLRWAVRTYTSGSGWTGEDYDPDLGQGEEFTSKPAAQAAYRALKFQPAPRQQNTYGGRRCDECGGSGARYERRDSSGIPGVVCARCDRSDDVELSFA